MVGIIDAANSTTNNNNNKEYLIFGDITPQWFERLNKISKNDDETLFRLYSEINDYKRCVIGEAYGYDESYVIQGTKRYCQECIALSGNFSYALRQYNSHKLEEVIERFTKHWNEKHSEVLLYKHRVYLCIRYMFLMLRTTTTTITIRLSLLLLRMRSRSVPYVTSRLDQNRLAKYVHAGLRVWIFYKEQGYTSKLVYTSNQRKATIIDSHCRSINMNLISVIFISFLLRKVISYSLTLYIIGFGIKHSFNTKYSLSLQV